MYTRSMLGDGGSLFDELAGFIDPQPEPIADEPTGVVVGHLSDDGNYTPREEQAIHDDHFRKALSTLMAEERQQLIARTSLKSMGFEIVEDSQVTIFEELGGIIADRT